MDSQAGELQPPHVYPTQCMPEARRTAKKERDGQGRPVRVLQETR